MANGFSRPACELLMLSYQWEAWHKIAWEAWPLMGFYYDHGGYLFAKELPLDPDFEAWAYLEVSGRLCVLTVRRDGYLIGLNGFNVGGMLLRAHAKVANGLVLYLAPSERKGMTGVRLIREAEKGLRLLGVHLIVYTNAGEVDLGPLLSRLGYSTQRGTTWEKLL